MIVRVVAVTAGLIAVTSVLMAMTSVLMAVTSVLVAVTTGHLKKKQELNIENQLLRTLRTTNNSWG